MSPNADVPDETARTPPNALRPICYMVMPFRTKRVEEPRPDGAPVEIDFDRLWELAYRPAIEAMGYLAMRADADPNMAIVQAMLERIAFADLVLADVTLGNGNCYYEIGVRHVAQKKRCVLVAPAWTRPLFDIAQFTSVRFPLTDGKVTVNEANTIRALLQNAVPGLADSQTPYWALIGPAVEDQGRHSAFRDFAERLSEFQATLGACRIEPDPVWQERNLRALIASLGPVTLGMAEVAVELVTTVRDVLGWGETVKLIESLPPSTHEMPWMREQYALAVAKRSESVTTKGAEQAGVIASLHQLIKELGETPERLGLIAGRYKALWNTEKKARQAAHLTEPGVLERQLLSRAIEFYERGMLRDYNAYFCSGNLPALLRERADDGDIERAAVVEHFVLAACDRARALGTGDEYLKPTLLAAAFRAGDLTTAASITRDIERDGPADWQLEATLADLHLAVHQTSDGDQRATLGALCARLERTLPPPGNSQ
ncbi:MAG: TRAFs-binding domain-containing protein [Gemmatimonadaceae bacterium]